MYNRLGEWPDGLWPATLVACVLVVGPASPVHAQRAATAMPAHGASPVRAPAGVSTDRQRAAAVLNKLPIRFERLDAKGTFLARGIGPAVRLSGTSIDFPIGSGSEPADSIRVQFVGARKSSRVVGLDELPGRVNYLDRNDDSRSRRNVRTYARAHTDSLYRGIDVEYYGEGDLLEYDLVVRPGARTSVIRLTVSGASSVGIGEDGDLICGDDRRGLLRKPVGYQMIDGARREVTVK
jgi:hypothetical protein